MICSCCYSDKDSLEFPRTPTGFRSYCKICYSYKKWWERQTPERRLEHNRKSREWAQDNLEKSRAIKKKSRESNPGQGEAARKEWKEVNAGLVNSYTAKRRAAKKKATPLWADLEEIALIYKIAKERGLVVDHIIPLQHPLVCGLHTQDNLRCITADLNARKGNFYFPDSLPVYRGTGGRKKGK